ncbi:uncharacterized protein [Parasteatoda tepidariorum]|uniref:uncharacterized protein n=1 Tax=Parasteatoda tepidariorum TaxID=114398 RepID=UPI0039BCEB02
MEDDDDDIVVEISNSSASDENVSIIEGFVFPKQRINSESLVPDFGPNEHVETSLLNSIIKEFKPMTQDKPVQAYPESFETPPSWLVELRFQVNCLFGKMLNTINFIEHCAITNLKSVPENDQEADNLKQIYDCCDDENNISLGSVDNEQLSKQFDENPVSKKDIGQRLTEMLDIITKVKSLVPVVEEEEDVMQTNKNVISNKLTKNYKSTTNLEEYGDVDAHPFQIYETTKSPKLKTNSYLKKNSSDSLRISSLEPKNFKLITNFINTDEDVLSEMSTVYYDCKSCRDSSKCSVDTLSSKSIPKTNSPHCSPRVLRNDKFTVPKLRNNFTENDPITPAQAATRVVSSTFDYEPMQSELQLGLLSNKPIKFSYDVVLPDKTCHQIHEERKAYFPKLDTNHKSEHLDKETTIPNARYCDLKADKERVCDSHSPSASQSCKTKRDDEHSKGDDFDMPQYITAIKRVRDRKPPTKRETDFAEGKPKNVKFDFMEYYTKVLELRIKYDKLKRNNHSLKGNEGNREHCKAQKQSKASPENVQIQQAEWQDMSLKEIKDPSEKIKSMDTTNQHGNSGMNLDTEIATPKKFSPKLVSDSFIGQFQQNRKTHVVNSAPRCSLRSHQSSGSKNIGLFSHSSNEKDAESRNKTKKVPNADWQDKLYKEIEEYFEKMKSTEKASHHGASGANFAATSTPHYTVQSRQSVEATETESYNDIKKETPTRARQSFKNILHFVSPFRLFKSNK